MIILLINFNNINTTYAENIRYARIVVSNGKLFSEAIESQDPQKVICNLERTYFVQVLVNFNQNFYQVIYNGINGFVLKTHLVLVSEIPNTPSPNGIKLETNSRCKLRRKPILNAEVLSIIPSNNQTIKFIGRTIGDELDDNDGNLWYLIEYNGTVGYVYNSYITQKTSIYPNLEEISIITEADFVTANPITNATCAILIGILCVPVLIIIFIMYKPQKLKDKTQQVVRNIDTIDDELL